MCVISRNSLQKKRNLKILLQNTKFNLKKKTTPYTPLLIENRKINRYFFSSYIHVCVEGMFVIGRHVCYNKFYNKNYFQISFYLICICVSLNFFFTWTNTESILVSINSNFPVYRLHVIEYTRVDTEHCISFSFYQLISIMISPFFYLFFFLATDWNSITIYIVPAVYFKTWCNYLQC